jgi:nucleoside-diphosphate-sugar epimerase
LVKEGYIVKVLDNLSAGKLENISKFIENGSVEFVKGDIRDESVVTSCLGDVSAVVHMAALVSVPLSIQNPELTFDINLTGTLNLLRSSAKAQISKFVFISSCAVCGDPQNLPVTEHTKPNPISPYAESKLLGERYALGLVNVGCCLQ